MKLREIAQQLGCTLVGDGEIEILGVAGIATAGPNDLTFLTNPRYRRMLKQTRAAAIIVEKDFRPLPLPTIRSTNPYLTFAQALELFYKPPSFPAGIHPTAVVSPRTQLGRGASIGPYCFIDDDVKIGDDCRLHSFVVIYRGARIGHDFTAHSHTVVREYCQIGNHVILQNGAVVGSDGFGFARQEDGRYYKIPQSGTVIVGDNVEIQAHTCIDRATIGQTRIERGAKLDNLVQVGHASTVGENSLLCAQVGLAGSTVVGRNVILGGQVGVAGHCEIGDDVQATAQTGVPNDVRPGQAIAGSPAIEKNLWLKCVALYARLPELSQELRTLRTELAALKQKKTRR